MVQRLLWVQAYIHTERSQLVLLVTALACACSRCWKTMCMPCITSLKKMLIQKVIALITIKVSPVLPTNELSSQPVALNLWLFSKKSLTIIVVVVALTCS